MIYEGRTPILRACGAGAVNQALKGAAIARGLVAPRGFDLYFVPGFGDFTTDEGESRSIMTLRVRVEH